MLLASIGQVPEKKLKTQKRVPFDTITCLTDTEFEVQGKSKYRVDLSIGMCTCPMGHDGGVCKHQTACAELTLQVSISTYKNKVVQFFILPCMFVCLFVFLCLCSRDCSRSYLTRTPFFIY